MKPRSIFVSITALLFMAVMYSIRGLDRQNETSTYFSQNKHFQDSNLSQKTGLILRTDAAFEGYTLFSPITSTSTFLIDIEGRVVKTWESDYEPGQTVYLLENGHLLRTAFVDPGANHTFHGGGAGGRVQEFTWDGKLVWDFEYNSDTCLLHHDIERLPNGNIFMIAWEKKTADKLLPQEGILKQLEMKGYGRILSSKLNPQEKHPVRSYGNGMSGTI